MTADRAGLDRVDRASLAGAGLLAIAGLLRLGSDVLTDANPSWSDALGDHWLRHAVRAPSDGTLAGDLNVRFAKVLAIPCGIAVAWFLNLLAAGSLGEADACWARRRTPALVTLAAIVTWIEIEKAGLGFGAPFVLLRGEVAAWNHGAHAVSAALGFALARHLRWSGPPLRNRITAPQSESRPPPAPPSTRR